MYKAQLTMQKIQNVLGILPMHIVPHFLGAFGGGLQANKSSSNGAITHILNMF